MRFWRRANGWSEAGESTDTSSGTPVGCVQLLKSVENCRKCSCPRTELLRKPGATSSHSRHKRHELEGAAGWAYRWLRRLALGTRLLGLSYVGCGADKMLTDC